MTGSAAVRLLPDVVREPDIFVLPPEQVPKAKGAPLEVEPALVVEVISPATRTADLKEKTGDYALAGVPEYWAVDPDRKEIVVHRLQGEGYAVERVSSGKVGSRSIPAFWLEAGWLFQEPLPQVTECLRAIPERT